METTDKEKLLEDEDFLKKTAHFTNNQLGWMLGVLPYRLSKYRRNIHHAVRGDNAPAKGNAGERMASAFLYANGIDHELMPWNHPFDILALDKVRIDVKIAHKPIESPSMKNYVSTIWRFNVRRDKRKDADFYMCIIAPMEEVFIIPADKVNPTAREIRFCWPTSVTLQSKWQQYLGAYDLIIEFFERSC